MRERAPSPTGWIGLLALAAPTAAAPTDEESADKSKPNVVIMLTDDQGYGEPWTSISQDTQP